VTIDVRGETAVSWCQKNTILLARYGTVPILFTDDGWRDWAAYIVSLPEIAAIGAPRPEPYPEWTDWARQANQSFRLLGL
jgi:hypothetical protein